MANIGGNITATLQKKTTIQNEIGENIDSWVDVQELKGFLDLSNGNSKYDTYNAKIKESTHLFIMDFVALQATEANGRLIVDGKVYEIKLIDDPMFLHEHLEIFLEYTGE